MHMNDSIPLSLEGKQLDSILAQNGPASFFIPDRPLPDRPCGHDHHGAVRKRVEREEEDGGQKDERI